MCHPYQWDWLFYFLFSIFYFLPQAIPFVDNALLSSSNYDDIVRQRKVFHARADSVGAVRKEGASIKTVDVFCGRVFDLTKQAVRLDPLWTSKVLSWIPSILIVGQQISYKKFYGLCGVCIWALMVFMIPMSGLCHQRSFMSMIASQVSKNKAFWRKTLTLEYELHHSFMHPITLLSNNPWRKFPTIPKEVRVICSDASVYGAAWAADLGACYWSWPRVFPSAYMFLLELITYVHAISTLAPMFPCTEFWIIGDAAGALIDLQKISASSDLHLMNSILFDLWQLLIFTKGAVRTWPVPSSQNKSDQLSRVYQYTF